MDKTRFTISVFTENVAGMLNKVCIIFIRRKINIESIAVSESEIDGIHRYTIVILSTDQQVQKVVAQLNKEVEVIVAVFHPDEAIVYQEIALYKIRTDTLATQVQAEKILRKHHTRVLSVEKEYTVIEKTGHKEETQQLFQELEPFGILEFVRSGRVAITKPMRTLQSVVEELEHNKK